MTKNEARRIADGKHAAWNFRPALLFGRVAFLIGSRPAITIMKARALKTVSLATRPEVIRDRQYTLQVAKALPLARENKLAPIDPAEVRAAKAEITETHVKAAYMVAWAWDNLANS